MATSSESPVHLALKRVALEWAHQNGFRIAATEVSLPNRGVRMDVAAYRPQRMKKQKNGKNVSCAAIGVTAIFECKVSTPDFRRDARSIIKTSERLELLHTKKLKLEDELKIFYPSIRNGDSLFQEFETLNFERPGYERYEKVLGEIRLLSSRLHENTKFEKLTKYGSANLYYLVAAPDVLAPHEMPSGWGWLRPVGNALELVTKPIWHGVDEDQRLEFLHRIAMKTTRTANPHVGQLEIFISAERQQRRSLTRERVCISSKHRSNENEVTRSAATILGCPTNAHHCGSAPNSQIQLPRSVTMCLDSL